MRLVEGPFVSTWKTHPQSREVPSRPLIDSGTRRTRGSAVEGSDADLTLAALARKNTALISNEVYINLNDIEKSWAQYFDHPILLAFPRPVRVLPPVFVPGSLYGYHLSIP